MEDLKERCVEAWKRFNFVANNKDAPGVFPLEWLAYSKHLRLEDEIRAACEDDEKAEKIIARCRKKGMK